MTSVYPMEEKPNVPPTYEQATYYPQPQGPPMPPFSGMYAPTPTVYQPQGQVPPMHMYPSNIMNGPPQPQPPPGTHILITTRGMLYGDMPIQCTCPHCYQPIVTRVEKQTGLATWLVCGGIILVGGWLGCCLIPFCVDGLKDTEHYCPNCAALLGSRRRM